MKKTLIPFLALFVFSCNYNNRPSFTNHLNEEEFNSIPITDLGNPQTFPDINVSLEYPSGIYVADSILILVEDYKRTNLLSIFNLSNNRLITSFGNRGKGPKEFSIAPTILQPNLITENVLELYDWEKKRITAYNFEKLLSNTSEIQYQYLLPPDIIEAQEAGFFNGELIATGTLKDGYLAFVDTQSLKLKHFPYDSTESARKLSLPDRAWFYNSWAEVNSSQNLFALAMYHFNTLKIYNVEGKLISETSFGDYDPTVDKNRELANYCYTQVTSSDDYIYAGWVGESLPSIEKIVENGSKPSSEIHQFDWEGNFIRRFKLSNNFASVFDVDEANNQFVIIDEFTSEPQLLFFKNEFIK